MESFVIPLQLLKMLVIMFIWHSWNE